MLIKIWSFDNVLCCVVVGKSAPPQLCHDGWVTARWEQDCNAASMGRDCTCQVTCAPFSCMQNLRAYHIWNGKRCSDSGYFERHEAIPMKHPGHLKRTILLPPSTRLTFQGNAILQLILLAIVG